MRLIFTIAGGVALGMGAHDLAQSFGQFLFALWRFTVS